MKTMNLAKCFVLIALVASSAWAEGRDGGVIGSGDPGPGRARRQRAEATSIPADVQIPSPPGFGTSSIEVRGQSFGGMIRTVAGAEVLFRKCEIDPVTDRPNLMGCQPWYVGALGVPVTVSPGFYQLTFSNSLYDLEIREGEQRVVQLQRLFLPATPFGTSVRIYRDLTAADEVRKAANDWVGSHPNQGTAYWLNVATQMYSGGAPLCDWNHFTGNSREPCFHLDRETNSRRAYAIAEPLIQGLPDGSASGGIFRGWRYPITHEWLIQTRTAAAWVFPGTYVVDYRTADGAITRVTGIHVDEAP